jgi:hypothetical protein
MKVLIQRVEWTGTQATEVTGGHYEAPSRLDC